MTDEELIAYFKDRQLPEILRINRAITQHEVTEAVRRNIENIKDSRAKDRLMDIMNAIETLYDGPGIPIL
jgi:hypothetical protein